MKKLIPILLTLVFVISSFTLAVSAATKTQDGIEADLSLTKAEYAAGEKIGVTLKIKNTTSAPIENVTSEIVLPTGVTLSSGELKQSAFTLAANETKNVSITAVKGSASASNSNSTPTGSSNTAGSPQTGDESIVIALAAMIVSGAAVVYLAVKKKAGKGLLSILLCVVVLGSCVLPTAVSADRAKKELTVEETFKVAGSSLTVKAIISYGGGAEGTDNSGNSGSDAGNDNAGNNDNSDSSDTSGVVQQPTDTNPEGEEILGEGSIDMPYMEIPNDDMTVTTVSIPAGGALYYGIYRVGGMILTINDANAYVEYNGARYDAQNGAVVIELENALASDAVNFVFGNNGSSDTSFVVEFSNPTGSYQNPTIIETMGTDNTISLEEGNEIGYYYKYYAEQAGTIRFYLTASVDSIIVVTNNRNSAQRSNDHDEVLTDENGVEYIEIEVEEGDELIITVGAKPNKRNKYPATDITWSGKYF